MSDGIDHERLYRLAESHSGFFTSAQAAEAGMHRSTLSHHARPGGRFERRARGLYRLRLFPESANDAIVAAWIPLAEVGAVVSHESALVLYGLSDLTPGCVHLSLPRALRGQRARSGVRLHTPERAPDEAEPRLVGGVPVTSPERAIVDSLASGSQPEQIEMAIREALRRGLTTQRRLEAAASGSSRRVRSMIEQATRGAM